MLKMSLALSLDSLLGCGEAKLAPCHDVVSISLTLTNNNNVYKWVFPVSYCHQFLTFHMSSMFPLVQFSLQLFFALIAENLFQNTYNHNLRSTHTKKILTGGGKVNAYGQPDRKISVFLTPSLIFCGA